MRKILFILLFPFFTEGQIVLQLDTFSRSVPDVGFNGNTVRGPSWVDSVFNDSVASMHPDILRYPGATAANFWDWDNGWFFPQSVLDTAITDTIYIMNAGWYSFDTIDIRLIRFQEALDQIDSEGLFIMNMMSSNVVIQSQALRNAINDGVVINKVELGSEINHNNIFKIMKYPTAGDYARECSLYIDSIKSILPNAEIAVVGGNTGSSNPRVNHWNDSIYNMLDSVDALVWHPYLYLKDVDTLFTTQEILAYPFYHIPKNEKWRCFQDTISKLQDYEIWVTEYNLFDKTHDLRYTNTWAHVLILSAMNNMLMSNNLVEMMLLHNVGGIIQNFDALDTDNDFRKKSTGLFASIWNEHLSDMITATRIEIPQLLIDSVEYPNSSGLMTSIAFPKLFGWKFENSTDEVIILSNISEDTIEVNVNNIINGNISWEKWTSDSLFSTIDSISYIKMRKDTSSTNIVLFPYSLNVAISSLSTSIIPFPSEIVKKKLLKIVDVLGRETFPKKNMPLFYIYEGGVVEKRIILE
ncbi:MAG: hypothetical protein H8E84_00655 [Flavobacteriales bacterium]|nr:hypothetical protein [Flavobacteriales bacterium]